MSLLFLGGIISLACPKPESPVHCTIIKGMLDEVYIGQKTVCKVSAGNMPLAYLNEN